MPSLRRSTFSSLAAAAWLAALVTASSPAAAKDGSVAVDAELVLAVDVSYSMNDDEQHLQRAGYVEAIKSPEFMQALKANNLGKVAVVYVEWASYVDQKVLVDWSLIDGPDSARAFADRLAEAPFRRARRTSISGAIDASMRLFDNNGYNGERRIIDISGDGPNNDGRGVVEARDEAVAKGVTINGLPLVNIRPFFGFANIENLGAIAHPEAPLAGRGRADCVETIAGGHAHVPFDHRDLSGNRVHATRGGLGVARP